MWCQEVYRRKWKKRKWKTRKLWVLVSMEWAETYRRALKEQCSHYLNTSISKWSKRDVEDQKMMLIHFLKCFQKYMLVYYSAGCPTVLCFKMDKPKSKNYPTQSTLFTIYSSGVTQCILIDISVRQYCISFSCFFALICHKFQQYLHLSIAKTALWQDHHSSSETLH